MVYIMISCISVKMMIAKMRPNGKIVIHIKEKFQQVRMVDARHVTRERPFYNLDMSIPLG